MTTLLILNLQLGDGYRIAVGDEITEPVVFREEAGSRGIGLGPYRHRELRRRVRHLPHAGDLSQKAIGGERRDRGQVGVERLLAGVERGDVARQCGQRRRQARDVRLRDSAPHTRAGGVAQERLRRPAGRVRGDPELRLKRQDRVGESRVMPRRRPLLDEVAGRERLRRRALLAAAAGGDDQVRAALGRVNEDLDLGRGRQAVDERGYSGLREFAGLRDRDKQIAHADVGGKRGRAVVCELDQTKGGVEGRGVFDYAGSWHRVLRIRLDGRAALLVDNRHDVFNYLRYSLPVLDVIQLGQARPQRRFELADFLAVDMAPRALRAGKMLERSCNPVAVRPVDLRYFFGGQRHF